MGTELCLLILKWPVGVCKDCPEARISEIYILLQPVRVKEWISNEREGTLYGSGALVCA